MIVNLLKFIHIIVILTLLGSIGYCLFLSLIQKLYANDVSFTSENVFVRLNKWMLGLVAVAAITGSLLVYPKHFTFHTPWIMAAYALVGIFSFGLILLVFVKYKRTSLMLRFTYFALFVLLCVLVHDAVTKSTGFL